MAIHSHFSYKQQGTETDFEIELLRVAGKMAHWLRALALLPEDLGSDHNLYNNSSSGSKALL